MLLATEAYVMNRSAHYNRNVELNSIAGASGRPLTSVRPLLVRIALFAAIFATLQFTWQAQHGSAIENTVIHHATVKPAVFLINKLTPDAHARAVAFTIRAPGGGLNILNGCEGLEALFLLVAGFAVTPLSLKSKLIGIALGIPVVFFANQVRILTLFYAYRNDPALFYPLHATVAPIAVVIFIAAYFYYWITSDPQHAQAA